MSFSVDHFSILKDAKVSGENAPTKIFQAKDNQSGKTCLAVICEITKTDDINRTEITNNMEFIRRWNFEGYLPILHFKITENAIFVFLDAGPTIRPLTELFQSNYVLSNVDFVRIGSLMVDSYELFFRSTKPHQDVEFDQLMFSKNPANPQDMKFYLLPPLPWATGLRVLNNVTINFKPLESLEMANIDPNDLQSVHKKFVWKFGLIMYLIINKKLPFSFADANPGSNVINRETVQKFARHIRNSNLTGWVTGRTPLTDLLQTCLNFSVDSRIAYPKLLISFQELRKLYFPETSQLSIAQTAQFGRQQSLPEQEPISRPKSHTLNAGLYSLVQNVAPESNKMPSNFTPQQPYPNGRHLTLSTSVNPNPFLVVFLDELGT